MHMSILSTFKHGALLLVLLSVIFQAQAHEIKPAIVDLNYLSQGADNKLEVRLVVNLESLIAEIEPTHENTDDSENSELYKELRALGQAELLSAFTQYEAQFFSLITLSSADDLPIALSTQSIDIPPVDNLALPRDTRIVLNATLPEMSDAVKWQSSLSFGEVILRANSDKQEMDFATLLPPGQTSALISFTEMSKSSVGSVVSNYIKLGFEHILPKGLDHILFVVGLFLLTPNFRPLLLQITTFTVAHSITLALGATKVLSVSSSIVEPLIALSIVFVCMENIWSNSLSRWRLAIVFFFGLLHGLGFASVLEEVGLSSTNFALALIGFNVGVELGQLVVIAACILFVGIWFGNKSWYRGYFSKPASLLLGLVGVYWFVLRTTS